ncbi:MAG: hypothetical protein ABR600_12030 [Actinomycetota bacterium]
MDAAAMRLDTVRTVPWAHTRRERPARRSTERKQDRNDSPLLHPDATQALLMAAAGPGAPGPQPVAVVLADGTVRALREDPGSERPRARGSMSGRDWILWWERRSWAVS